MTQQYRPKNPYNDPESWRSLLAAYERMLEVAVEVRGEAAAAGADLRTRIVYAGVIDRIDGWIADARRQLRKAEGRAAEKAVCHGC